MGRSKFPGKPPKTVTRKRIKVLGRPEANQSDSATVAENIYYGLSLFNETFGDNEKEHPPFHGFSSNEAKLSVSYVKTQQRDAGSTETKAAMAVETITKDGNIDICQNLCSDTENVKEIVDDNKNLEGKPLIERVQTGINAKVVSTIIHSSKDDRYCKDANLENMVKAPVLKSVNNILDRHQRTRQLRNSTAKRLLQRAKSNSGIGNTRNVTIQCTSDKSNAVRKFVLPVRSVHSSRVIKPNKRFIEELEDTQSSDLCENETGKNSKKAKILSGKNVEKEVVMKELEIVSLQTDDKETKNKSKKVQCTILSSENYDKITEIDINLSNIAQDAQYSLVKNSDTPRLVDKVISVPTKVLPDFNVPIVESSRVQTRSGTLNETSGDTNSQVKPETPCEPDESRPMDESEMATDAFDKTLVANNDESDSEHDDEMEKSKSSEDSDTSESTLSESGCEHDDHSEDEQSEWTGMKMNGGKVILRKARLKLDNKRLSGTEGPFSTTNNNIPATGNSIQGPTATVKCGVCGAVRFYRFVKQARKFGIHSCESCRKFISKMIKRQTCAKSVNNTLPILQCHKGDGLCLVPPVVRSQQWNLMRCVYKARCPACWLKMCLNCYNIPSSLRTGLYALLPPLMRDPVISLSLGQDDNETIGQNKSIGGKISWPAEDSLEKNLFKSAMSWSNMEIGRKPAYHGNTGGLLSKKLDKFDYPISMSPSKKRKNDNRIKVRKKMKNPLVISTTINQPMTQLPRQRIDLKGPRVKHVCRSASVALGQPLATFPSTDGKELETESAKILGKSQREEEKLEKKDEDQPKEKDNNSQKSNQESSCSTTSSTSSSNGVQTSYARRTKSQHNVLASNHQVVRSLPKPRMDEIHTISIDFWEQYDPAEVGTKGFALIASELFHIPAVCFLCGSSGREPLIHCQCCCEPYHAFCLEPSEWNACAQPSWCCPRCTICQTCRLRSGPKLSCIRCRQSFHHSCLSKSGVSARLYSPDRPYVCSSCIKCKSCGSEGVNVHVGNLPLCSMCFKLRQRGNYCPLCQRCYNENDFDTKMMECNECSCWVHARCEGLSDESYQILSYLPDSIEFTCSQCSPQPNSMWRSAIESELKAGFNAVIKALSRNRKACAALKWSPRKECLCKPLGTARRLEFFDSERYHNCDESEDCCSDKSTDAMSNTTGTDSNSSSRTRYDFELDDQTIEPPRRGLRRLRQKFHLKNCSVRVKNCISKDGQDSQDFSSDGRDCSCSEQQIIARPSPSLMTVKRKVNGNEYNSLVQFYCDMEHVVNRVGGQELVDAFHKSLREVFPWFDPKCVEFNVPSNEGGGKDHSKKLLDSSPTKLDDSILETWKEEVAKAPKAIAAKTGNLYSNLNAEDSRSCCLCKGLSDGQETKEGRLLYCGQNEWIHSNCALWSNEVFEEIDGSLQNVHSAISRGRLIRCTECGKKGASVGCCSKNCNNTFHFPCARSLGLAFNDDKTVFCILHLANCQNRTSQIEADFDLRRPVYVELDRKKKKYAEPDKVKVMIGSLTVDCLGSVVPQFSDTTDKILPANYKCSRLYWSTVNPMKIVRYYIRTYVQMYVPEVCTEVENNITIDHSKEREKEEALMDREKIDKMAVKQTLEALIDAVCNREVDENLAEQNNTDLLPPEIKDAIFEDLPHDLLDGISMQDIFPKMTYEDFLAMDLKSDGVFGQDLLKDEILPGEVEDIMKPPESKISRIDGGPQSIAETTSPNDFWLHLGAKGSVQDFMDDLLSAKSQKLGGRELKRSKSEVMTNNSLIVGGQRHHQRSCSLTWSCKLDGTYGPTMKRRKLPRAPATTRSGEANVMLVDSQNVERSSLFHELRIPESIMVTVGRSNTPSIISESVRELKYCIDENPAINRRVPPRDDSKDHKRLLWQHTRQQPRILQVDGPADPSSASECSSPEYNIEERILRSLGSENIPQVDGTNDDSCDNSDWFTYKDRHRLFSTESASSSSDESHELRENTKISGNIVNNLRNHQKDEDSKEHDLRIPQLDGADDISSDEESLSPRLIENETIPMYVAISDLQDRPVTCKRCKCTYRTRDSYDRHLSNCDLVTTSDSDSETMDNKGTSPDSRFSPSIGSMSPQFVIMSPSEGHTMSSEYPETQITSPLEASVASPHSTMQIEPIAQALITPQIHSHSTVETLHQTVLTSNDMIVQTQYTRTTTTLPNPTAVLPQESTVQITEIADSPPPAPSESITQNSLNIPPILSERSQISHNPRVITPNYTSGVATNENIIQHGNIQTTRVTKPKSPRVPRPRAKVIKPNNVRNSIPAQHTNQVRYQVPVQTNPPVLQIQQQRPSGPTVILQQVPTQGIMSAYVETLQQQSGQNLQYITTLGGGGGGGQQETSYKPQFITTNQLVPGAYIQAASDNLLALQNGGISVLPSVQISQQQQPTVLGTIIQQQPNAIQCGFSSEQLVLSSTPTLEMFSDSTGSMFVSQPMYYGLETIVSNTVMSSSQFMTGAVPQVLASSYQTTTQVFQASKLMEPMVDVQTLPAVSSVQAVQAVPTVHGSYVVMNQTAPAPEPMPRPPPPTPQPPPPPPPPPPQINISPVGETNFVIPNCETIALAPCPISNEQRTQIITPDPRSLNPYETSPRIISPTKSIQQQMSTIPRVAVRPSPATHTVTQMNHAQWKVNEPLYTNDQTIDNNTRPYFDSKHVSDNTSMIKSSIASKMPPLQNLIQRNTIVNNKMACDVNNVHNYNNTIANVSKNVGVSPSGNNCNAVASSPVQNKLTIPPVVPPLCRPMNRVLPMQAVMPKLETVKPVKKPGIIIEEPTKPVMKSPIGEPEESVMKMVIKPIVDVELVEKEKIEEFKMADIINAEPVKLDIPSVDESKRIVKLDIPEIKECPKIVESTPLKMVLQKQLEDGSYKITQNMKLPGQQSKNHPKITSVEILNPKQTPQITSLQLLPIKTFTLKANKTEETSVNLPKTRPPPIAVKKPRFVAKVASTTAKKDSPVDKTSKQTLTGPSLMYEIKSQDGFTHTASSMAEVWETVFQAVQNARKAHNLPPLAHNPLTEGLGLENNATVYLVEQLAGVNRCTKYKPKFHDLKPPKIRDLENDIFSECANGAARAEPFKGRKVHDVFSWLASRHRQQPKMIAISETEMRRAASTNLPMAMRFRVLKETSKESVGVYHSHIHGRGLFCLRDIEAGEMVIEYAGEVIRASLTDKREKYYDSKNIGCYMFKIDDHLVVDATMKGNAARFINHSCEPNCYSRVVDILGKKHILIFALRRIVQGEELTYDYKFPFEDIKIPCTCGSRRCRKYLN